MMKRRRIGHAGTSIVEILVAMVILVIGIFGIIRVFPIGFGMIGYGEQVSRAEKLANAALESARARAANLPDGVVPITPDPQNPLMALLDPSVTPAVEAYDFSNPAWNGLPTDPLAARFFGFNRTRRVMGETTKIPPPTANVPYMPIDPVTRSPQLVSLYTVQFGPIDTASFRPLVYSGQGMERAVYVQDPAPAEVDALGLFRYGVQYQRDRLVLFFAPVTYARVFKIQYSYVISDPQGPFRAQSLPDAAVAVPADASRVEVMMPSGGTPEQGEEVLARAFMEIPLVEPFSTRDPFEFKVLNAFVGILGFNPLGALARSGSDNRGLSAKLDYDVADWHIVSEDLVVPQEPPFRLKLTLNFLKRANSIQANQTVYSGLLPVSGFNGIDLVVVDLDRGVTIDSRTLSPEEANDNGAVLYRTGAIDFASTVRWDLPPAGVLGVPESIAGHHVRVYYRTENDFGMQIQKAFTNYLRSQVPTSVTPGQYGQMPFGYLLFPASDHNQMVLLDYSFTEDLGMGATRRVRVSGELQPIRDPAVDQDSPIRAFGNLPPHTWFVRVNNAPRFDATDGAGRPNVVTTEPIVIHSVRGVSMRARTIWREGSRWRRLENSTYLSRQSS
jgi:hypothetical protein